MTIIESIDGYKWKLDDKIEEIVFPLVFTGFITIQQRKDWKVKEYIGISQIKRIYNETGCFP